MTSYWKPRWPNLVFFGSYRELQYRIDIRGGEESLFRLISNSGPGFTLTLLRAPESPGFVPQGATPPEADVLWLNNEPCRRAIASLMEIHFSRLIAAGNSIQCFCDPARDDILPEGRQLTWCMEQVHLLWSAVPAEARRSLPKSDFMA
ncbi:MAG TPA: hypothetical protein VM658_14800 [bacterium]|nr:hypothetical protein [bacterium]